MNKTYYIKPAIEITEINVEHAILAASNDELPIDGNKETPSAGIKDHTFGVNVWGEDEE